MIYTLNICQGSQVVNAGTGGPSIWVGLDDAVGTFRIGSPGGIMILAHLAHYGIDDAWHTLKQSEDVYDGVAWWVRHVSWTKVEVEYRI